MPFRSATTPDAQRIVDTLHEPLLVLDPSLRVHLANPAFYDTFSTHADATLGTKIVDLLDGAWNVPALRQKLHALVENETPFEGLEVDLDIPELGRRVLRLNGQTLVGGDADTTRLLVAMEDMTEQRKLEEKLRTHSKELERSNADLEQFAYAASHDLQEPLRMVSSYLQLLERRYGDELDGEALEFMNYAVDGAKRMKALINGLLQYSRVGRKETGFDTVDLDAVVDDVHRDLKRRIEETDATISVEPLPTTFGNRDQLTRVVRNLVSNALTYHGDAPPRIHVSGHEQDDGGVEMVIRDHGPGIPPESQTSIFQIFKQLDPHGTGREGTGMGLALARKIVERHNGSIWVESTPGEGAAFHVTLNLTPDDVS